MGEQYISKIDAASRQLDLAIRMHFQDADVIGVLTLAGAAHGILRDLLAQPDASKLAPAPRAVGKSPQEKHVTRMVREAIGFLKHADHTPNLSLRFNPRWTDFLLYEAVEHHIRYTGTLAHSNIMFLLWVTARYPTVRFFEELLGDGAAELRLLYPKLVLAGTQKLAFLTVLEQQQSVAP